MEICIQDYQTNKFKWFNVDNINSTDDIDKMRRKLGKNTFFVDSDFSDSPESLTNGMVLELVEFVNEEEGNLAKFLALTNNDIYTITNAIRIIKDASFCTKWELICQRLGLNENGQDKEGKDVEWLMYIDEDHVWNDVEICNQVVLIEGYECSMNSTWMII